MNKLGKIFVFVGILLIGSSLVLFIFNNYVEYEAGRESANVVNVIKNDFDINKVTIAESVMNNDGMAITKVDSYDYIGVIAIPSLNLELPVMSEYDEDRLKIAPVRYYGSIYTNDLIICAHSYKTHFGYLRKLHQGEKVIFTDINGNIYGYEVLEIEVLGANDVTNMIDNNFDLTLYTCTSDGKSRITVRCNRLDNDINI